MPYVYAVRMRMLHICVCRTYACAVCVCLWEEAPKLLKKYFPEVKQKSLMQAWLLIKIRQPSRLKTDSYVDIFVICLFRWDPITYFIHLFSKR